jgi:hypothetical protein
MEAGVRVPGYRHPDSWVTLETGNWRPVSSFRVSVSSAINLSNATGNRPLATGDSHLAIGTLNPAYNHHCN